ncbi:MAG: S4 domain-containing protein [bacterium]
MRLDLFLKRAGLVKQRTLARDICGRGRVRVGGGVAKAGKEVGPGSVIELDLESELVEIEILGLPERNYRRKEGEALYRVRARTRKDFL